MGFVEIVLSSYGIEKKGDKAVVGDLAESDKEYKCAEGDQACKDKWNAMKRSGKALDSVDIDGDDGQKWVDMHDDIMRRTRVDKSVSRFKMLWTLYKATPGWVKIIMSIMIIIFVLIAFIPGLVILLEVLQNEIAIFKLTFLFAFGLMIFIGFSLIPI